MGSLRLTLCTTLLAVTALTTPAAHAADGAAVAVTPSSPAPGTDIALRVSGCADRTGTAVSAAFVADVRLTGADGTLVGETRVRTELRAGSYDVQVTCGEMSHKAAVTVVQEPSPHTSPVAPVQAGGGGTAHLAAADARAAGPGTAQAVTGLVLAGVAAAAVVLRRVRRSRGTD
ncbi:hypothetical protein OG864_31985 [Streptomyces sp. NBC_00124]|uniref:hypothetical protein n=1 Tax=Streptomyces sp. NBC_00124 TaxID=2975662 RepID=UPI0022528820|nr:hypothetical protein [Streptomyces sp. NBC_00124]MCX5363316.1 hypothetical protein [Streptomyces sp. NBC_00124]